MTVSAHPTAPRREEMTSRERILAAVAGEPVDRFPVWLKMTNRTWQAAQDEPYRSMDGETLLTRCGCDVMLHVGGAVESRLPRVRVEQTQAKGRRRTIWQTPDGDLTAVAAFDPYTESWHPCEYPITSAEDLIRARWLFEGAAHGPSDRAADARRQQQQWRDRQYVTFTCLGAGPLMDFVEHLAGPENAIYLLADEPQRCGELLALACESRLAELSALLDALPTDMVWMVENTSTTLISPGLFREHCMDYLRRAGQMILDRGVIPVHHMCGCLNALLEDIDSLPAQANEAYTTRPLGDVSLAEGRTRMPSKCLIGGTNATLWLQPPEEIVQTVAEDLANCPDTRKIFLTSAGVLPAGVNFDKARTVVEGLKRLG